jgi:hypothetical protein
MEEKVKIHNETIAINSEASSLAPRIILLVLTTISFLIPIAATIFAILILELKPAILITYIIFGLSGYFFLKLYLWNKHGKEILSLKRDKINYHADYKIFIGNKREINSDAVKIEYLESVEEKENFGTLKLSNDNAIIETVIKLPLNDLERIKNKINEYYA